MKFIIKESQQNFIWLLRRLNEEDIKEHLREIIVEGFDYYKPCDYTYDNGFNDWVTSIIEGSVDTFIYSYDDKFKSNEGIESLRGFLMDYVRKGYGRSLKKYYTEEIEDNECG